MEKNVGTTDQIVRIAAGATLGTVSLLILASVSPGPEVLSPILGALSLPLLVTGLTGSCGLYSALGVSTCPVDPEPE